VRNEIEEHPKTGRFRRVKWNRGEPIQAEEHRWDGGVLIPAEELGKGVSNECGMHYGSAGGN